MKPSSGHTVTVLGLSPAEKTLIWLVPPILGFAIGWLIPSIARWAALLKWFPFQGPLSLIASVEGSWVGYATALLGGIVGLVLSSIAFKESLTVAVSDHEVRFCVNGTEETFTKEEVSVCFPDGKQLVLLDREQKWLYSEKCDVPISKLASAFERHGYKWLPADPFMNRYRIWVPNSPDLDPSANALLHARKKALEKKERKDADAYKQELGNLGITIRDEGTQQYWRV